MKTGPAAIEKLKFIEGFLPTWKRDVNKLAIGYGHNEQPNDRNWIKEPITKAQAEVILKKDLELFEGIINKAIKVPLSQLQYDALILWVYNTGKTKSTLFDLINAKADLKTITDWWRTHYITTQEKDPIRAEQLKKALIKRRAEEAEMFEKGTQKGNIFFLPLILLAIYLIKKKFK